VKEIIMRQLHTLSKTVIAVSILAACSSVQKPNVALDEARSEYQAAQANPQVVSMAPTELQQASEALNAATSSWEHRDKDEKVDQLAHIAKDKIAIAQQTASQKAAEAKIADAAKEREKLQLDERTAEADKANERANQLAEQLKELAAKQTDRGMVVTLNDLLFNVNKAELSPGGMLTVQKVADVLTKYPERNVLVEGFTDSTGTPDYNLDLSMRRANAVRLALISMGVGAERIVAHGNGQEYPVATNDTAAGRQMNRRVEIVFPGETSKAVSQN
jgi:outer membrane protein OmpA-like peptidoglycan-associated protein